MKTLQRFCAAFVLTLALALPAFAGDISTTVVSQPPPTEQTTTAGDMQAGYTGNMSTGVTAPDPATEVMLSLLDSLLSLF